MKLKFSIYFIIAILLFEGNHLNLFSQDQYRKLQHDIEIMETILNKMFLTTEHCLPFYHKGANGFYLDGHGILFEVPYSADRLWDNTWFRTDHEDDILIDFNHNKKHRETIRNQNRAIRIRDTNDEDNDVAKQRINEEIENIKNKLTRFLGDYASAISGLKSEQSITVVMDFNGSLFWTGLLPQDQIRKLMAKAQIKDIANYRKGLTSLEEFKKKIVFNTKVQTTSIMDEDIDILADVIESSLGNNLKQDKYVLANGVKGLYVNGYGAIFILSTNMGPNFFQIITKKSNDEQDHNYTFQSVWSGDENAMNVDEKINLLQDKVINLMSRFGHTMRHLDNNEWLEIALNINAQHVEKDFSKVIMKIKKSDIDRFNRQQINQNDFKKIVRVIKY